MSTEPARTGLVARARAALDEGRVTARALVTRSLELLDATADTLNVLAQSNADAALREAERYDRDPRPGALAGLPILVKDLEDVAGLPTWKGSTTLRDAPKATSDGVVPARLRAEGAIVVGKSTLPEFAIEGFTASRLHGVTRNPWHLDYSPGGSSGGSAAALAAGLVFAATATDGGGSIRIPASLCGLVGLKPTNGAIGRWPAPDWIDYSTDGPFATTVADLRLLVDVLYGPVAGDPGAPPRHALDAERPAPTHLVAATRTSPLGPLDSAVASRLRDGVAALEDLFAMSAAWREPDTFFVDGDPDLDWFTICGAEHVNALGRDFVETHFDAFDVATQEFFQHGLRVDLDAYLDARRRRYRYVRALDELLGDGGLLITPSVAAPGWLADGRRNATSEVHALAPEVYSTAVQNVTGHPALSLPFGAYDTGVPFGLQVTAPRFQDRRLLALAARFEARHPWPTRAPGYPGFDDLLGD